MLMLMLRLVCCHYESWTCYPLILVVLPWNFLMLSSRHIYIVTLWCAAFSVEEKNSLCINTWFSTWPWMSMIGAPVLIIKDWDLRLVVINATREWVYCSLLSLVHSMAKFSAFLCHGSKWIQMSKPINKRLKIIHFVHHSPPCFYTQVSLITSFTNEQSILICRGYVMLCYVFFILIYIKAKLPYLNYNCE